MINPILSILVASILFSGCAQKPEERQIQKEENKISLQLEATVYPYETKFISGLNGKVDKIYKNVGDYVNSGDLIYTIDTELIKKQIKQVKNEILILEKERRYNNSGNNGFNPTVVHLARINLEKVAKLYAQGLTSEQRYNEAKNTYAIALFDNENQRNNNNRQRYTIEQNLEDKRNELYLLNERLNNSEVKSKMNGFIDRLDIYEGYQVGEGERVGSVIDISKLKIKAGIASGLINYVKKDQLISVSFVSTSYIPSQTVPITRVVPLIDPEFGRIIIETEVDNINNMIQPKNKAIVKVPLSEEEQNKLKQAREVDKYLNNEGSLPIKSRNQ